MAEFVASSVVPIHKFADISIYRYFFQNTADTDSDSDILIILDENNKFINNYNKLNDK